MIPFDYELGRQYQHERVQEATSHRLACQALAGWPRVAHRFHFPIAKRLHTWIDDMVGIATRRAETLHRSSVSTR
jgi:hypothetical protein